MRCTICLATLFAATAPVFAAVQIAYTVVPGDQPTLPVARGDLLETAVVSRDSGGNLFNLQGTGGLAVLTDGTFGPGGNGNFAGTFAASASTGAGGFVIYNLDTGARPAGYSVGYIDVFAGWDRGRDDLNVIVSYSTVSNPASFISLGNAFVSPPDGPNNAVQARYFDPTGWLATGVAAVRFDFPSPQENGGVFYRELDVVVPEPTGLALLAPLGLVLTRRRSR